MLPAGLTGRRGSVAEKATDARAGNNPERGPHDHRAHIRCACAAEFGLDQFILLCPCGSADVAVLSGQGLAIRSVEVA